MMNSPAKTLQFTLERTIAASPTEAFDAWLNPAVPGTPWNLAEKFILDPRVDGLFFWTVRGKGIYGRFTEVNRPGRLRHTWVSPNTLGLESTVTVTFARHGDSTLMTLAHSDLPDHELAKGHEQGWAHILDALPRYFIEARH